MRLLSYVMMITSFNSIHCVDFKWKMMWLPKAVKQPKYITKKIRQNKYSHKLDRKEAFRLSVLALRRLQESASHLNVTARHFPVIYDVSPQKFSYRMSHQGNAIKSLDNIDKQVEEMITIMKAARVRHLDFGPHCKNFVSTNGTLSLIDFDILSVEINGTWIPSEYQRRFVNHGITWEQYHNRMLKTIRNCIK